MPKFIGLPDIKAGPKADAHPYPFQIGYQTREFINGFIFYNVISDLSAAKQISTLEGIKAFINDVKKDFYSPQVIKDNLAILDKYIAIFSSIPFKNVLITLNSQWDWYVRKLAAFIEFCRSSTNADTLPKEIQKKLKMIGFLSILEQLSTLEAATGICFNISESNRTNLHSMSLLRNIGIHNRWEVDEKYIELSNEKHWQIGEIRTFNQHDLSKWDLSIQEVIQVITKEVAVKYKDAPAYTG